MGRTVTKSIAINNFVPNIMYLYNIVENQC